MHLQEVHLRNAGHAHNPCWVTYAAPTCDISLTATPYNQRFCVMLTQLKFVCGCACAQLVYSRNGVNITATPVEHYTTAGPVAYRLDWEGLSVTYSGAPAVVPLPIPCGSQCSPIHPVAFPGYNPCSQCCSTSGCLRTSLYCESPCCPLCIKELALRSEGLHASAMPAVLCWFEAHLSTHGVLHAPRALKRSLMCQPAGDTHPTAALNELAAGTDVHIQQIMGPLPAFDTLSFESQYLLNVRPPCPYYLFLAACLPVGAVCTLSLEVLPVCAVCASPSFGGCISPC